MRSCWVVERAALRSTATATIVRFCRMSIPRHFVRQPTRGGVMKRFNVLLWVVQGLLAALFVFAGAIKLVLPLEALTAGPVPLPGLFLRFIGVAEVLGAFGLIL